MVEGENKPDLGHAITKAIADAGINVAFLSAQALGKKFVAVFGFADQTGAAKAAGIIKKAARDEAGAQAGRQGSRQGRGKDCGQTGSEETDVAQTHGDQEQVIRSALR